MQISDHRFDELSALKWYAYWNPSTESFYAVRGIRKSNGKMRMFPMHRQILGLEFGDKRDGDHINHNTLDNRDENLRIATRSENGRNRGANANNTTGFKGVTWDKDRMKWRARIMLNRKMIHLGLFVTPEAAHSAYCEAAKQYHGDFAQF